MHFASWYKSTKKKNLIEVSFKVALISKTTKRMRFSNKVFVLQNFKNRYLKFECISNLTKSKAGPGRLFSKNYKYRNKYNLEICVPIDFYDMHRSKEILSSYVLVHVLFKCKKLRRRKLLFSIFSIR